MATVNATTLATMLELVNPNILDLSDPTSGGVSLKPLLELWRTSFFPLLDTNDPSQKEIHKWIIPTMALENRLESTPQSWWEIGEVVSLVSNTISAAGFNGYTPSGALEVSMIAAFNAAWT